MAKEWEYILGKDEVYFTSQFRFPYQNIKQLLLGRGKSGTTFIVVGIILSLLSLLLWGKASISMLAMLFTFGIALLAWGIKLNRTYEVGFVILKDPKYYEKTFVSIFRTHSLKKAEERLQKLHEELGKKGLDRIRIVREV